MAHDFKVDMASGTSKDAPSTRGIVPPPSGNALYRALDVRDARIKELEASLLAESERAEILAREADSYRVRYEASQEALSETQVELREVGDILGADEGESTIDAARRAQQEAGALLIAAKRVAKRVMGRD